MSSARSLPDPIGRARALLNGSEHVLVLTGAGISADSGVPTFRGKDGLWKRHRPEELATPEAFERDPRLVWEWYGWRREVVAACRPNAAHQALARWCLAMPHVHIVTQNVDGLHRTAAERLERSHSAPSPDEARTTRLIELHGSLFRTRCTGCGDRAAHTGPVDAFSARSLPRCKRCDALLRPDVVWFGEPLDDGQLRRSFELAANSDACLVVGTSAAVQPAASIAAAALRASARLIEVNVERTPLTASAEVSLRASAAEVVPLLTVG